MNVSKFKAIADLAFDHAQYRKTLRERIQGELILTHNGGMFMITPELLAFVAYWPVPELYLEDMHKNPIAVDRQIFLVQAQERYHYVMNTWHAEFEASKRIRRGTGD
jgi:hypothetical protein